MCLISVIISLSAIVYNRLYLAVNSIDSNETHTQCLLGK